VVSVSPSVTRVHPKNTAERIEVLFSVETFVDPSNTVLSGILDPPQEGEGKGICCSVVGRECIPGLPFPGRLGIPVIIRSRIPGNRTASFLAKTGTVQLTALLSFSVVAAC